MRKQRLTALRIGVSRRGLALAGMRGRLRPQTDILADLRIDSGTGAEFGELGNRLDAAIRDAHCSRLPATVVIANELARFFMVTPPHNAAGLQDGRAAAAMRFHALFGEPADAWQLAADWCFDKPFLACALPRILTEAICRVAETHRLTLLEVAPHFVAAWNAWSTRLKPDAWFGVAHGDMLTLGATAHGHLVSVRSTSFPAGEHNGLEWLGQHLAREALRLNLDAPSRIQLCGDVPERWTNPSAGPLVCERLGSAPPGSGRNANASSIVLALTGVQP